MSRNLKGGKAYKKNAKKDAVVDMEALMIERQPDQQIARVIKVLGGMNMSCYCNDNKVRICHIRGKMRKRVFVELGDVVLISLREFEEGASTSHDDLRGDILAKYPHEMLSSLKKEAGVNPKLFLSLETMDGTRLAEIGAKNTIVEGDEEEEGGFEFDHTAEAPSTNKKEGDSESDSDEEIDVDAI